MAPQRVKLNVFHFVSSILCFLFSMTFAATSSERNKSNSDLLRGLDLFMADNNNDKNKNDDNVDDNDD